MVVSWDNASIDEALQLRDDISRPLASSGCELQPAFTVVPMRGPSAASSTASVHKPSLVEPILLPESSGAAVTMVRALVICRGKPHVAPAPAVPPGFYLSAEVTGPTARVVPAIKAAASANGKQQVFELTWPMSDTGSFELRVFQWYHDLFFGFKGGCQNKQVKLIQLPTTHVGRSPMSFSVLGSNNAPRRDDELPFCTRGASVGRWVSPQNSSGTQDEHLLTKSYGPNEKLPYRHEWRPIHCRLRSWTDVGAVADALARSFFSPLYGQSASKLPWTVNFHFIGDSTGFYMGGVAAAALSKVPILHDGKFTGFTSHDGGKYRTRAYRTETTSALNEEIRLVVHTYQSTKAVTALGQLAVLRDIKKDKRTYNPRKGGANGGGESHVFVFGDSTAHYNCPRFGWQDFEGIRKRTRDGAQELIQEATATSESDPGTIAAVWLAPLFPVKTWVKRARVLREDQMELWRAAETGKKVPCRSTDSTKSNEASSGRGSASDGPRVVVVDQWAISEAPGMDGGGGDGVHYHHTYTPNGGGDRYAFKPHAILHTVIGSMLTALVG